QQAEAGPEGGAGQHHDEEDAAAAAGQVEQAEQAADGGEHAEDRDGGAVHRPPAHLECHRAHDERADAGRDERRVAGVGLVREHLTGHPERVEERARADDDHERVEQGGPDAGHARLTAASTSSTVRYGGNTRMTCGANNEPASTVWASPWATTSPSPRTTAR